MKVYIQVINKMTGIYQQGMIEEPVVKGKEVENALAHFGISYPAVDWEYKSDIFYCGQVQNTQLFISVFII